MPCTLTTGRAIPCGSVIGGIKSVYFENYLNLPESTSWSFSAGRLSNWGTGTSTVYEYGTRPELSSLSVTTNTDYNTGGYFYEQVLTLVLNSVQDTDFAELNELINARPNVFVLDFNDNVYLLGAQWGMQVTGGGWETGTSFTDPNKLEVILTGKELTMAYQLTQTAGQTTANYPFDAVTNAVTIDP